MNKKQGWPEILAAYVKEKLFVPYAWGKNDCVTYPADAILLMTDSDPIGDIRGTWDTEESANDVLSGLGGLISAVDARLNRYPSPMQATRGDVMMVKINGVPTLGICVGVHLAAPGDNETLFINRGEARMAWEV
jgi:hypothetical protein